MEGSLILTEAIQKECDRGIQGFIPPRPTKRNAIEQSSKRVIVGDDAYLKLMVVSVAQSEIIVLALY